jgi:hypothetical protein
MWACVLIPSLAATAARLTIRLKHIHAERALTPNKNATYQSAGMMYDAGARGDIDLNPA